MPLDWEQLVVDSSDPQALGRWWVGEEVLAAVRLYDRASVIGKELPAFCRGKVAHYKVLRYVRFVDARSTKVTGKVQT